MQYEYLKALEDSRRFRSRATEFPHDCTIISQYGSELVETGFVFGL